MWKTLRTVLVIVIAAYMASVSFTECLAQPYYISNSGNDANSGTSQTSPWKTLNKVNNYNFQPGDVISFRCGNTWRGQLLPKSGSAGGGCITYTQYGTGAKPVIMGSVSKNSQSDWTNLGGNIWGILPSWTSTTELIPDGGFESGAAGWYLYAGAGASATGSLITTDKYEGATCYKINLVTGGSALADVQFYKYNPGTALEAGKTYKLTFAAKSSKAFNIGSINLQKSSQPFTDYSPSAYSATITTDWQTYTYYYTSTVTATDCRPVFFLGGPDKSNTTLYFDAISLKEYVADGDVANITPGNELIPNGGFESGADEWYLYANTDADADATGSLITTDKYEGVKCYKIELANGGSALADVQFFKYNPCIALKAGKTYKLTFAARSSKAFKIGCINLQKTSPPFTDYVTSTSSPTITTDWQTYTYYYTSTATATDCRLGFFLGTQSDTTLYLDAISLKEYDILTVGDVGNIILNNELTPDGGFESGAAGWYLYANTDASADATGSLITTDKYEGATCYKIELANGGPALADVQFYKYNPGTALEAGKTYKLTFAAKSSKEFKIGSINLQKSSQPFTDYSPSAYSATITTDWQTYTYYYTSTVTATDCRPVFFLGGLSQSNTTLYLDTISLKEEDFGVKKLDSSLASQNDFWYDRGNKILKVYSVGNPAGLYNSLECVLDYPAVPIHNNSYVEFNGLHVTCANYGLGGEFTHHIKISNCDISYIGGTGGGDAEIRAGNGVEFWGDAHDNTVEYCNLWQVYDAALSNQCTTTNTQYNLYYRHNNIRNCEFGFEIWNRPADSVMHDIYFENNNVENAGKGWGHSQRPDPRATFLMMYNSTATAYNIYIRNNTFNTTLQYCICNIGSWNGIDSIVLDYNTYSVDNDNIFKWKDVDYLATPTGWEQYKFNSGKDANSTINIQP